jgi:hypothetical protein
MPSVRAVMATVTYRTVHVPGKFFCIAEHRFGIGAGNGLAPQPKLQKNGTRNFPLYCKASGFR